ncbi:MAG: class II fructose-bisphosphate aldolase [Candidatus Levybacteria bacterium]|nr:class II fructose-bisphosphate aldolase [Candidatus Levybacteria bacterium]
MFVTTKTLLDIAQTEKFAVGAFNVNDMEIVQGIVLAAMELQAPIILQISKGAREYANPLYLKKLIEAAEEESKLPIAMHLDHGPSVEMCKAAVDEGYTSVMFDGSHEDFETNIKLTKEVVTYAHAKGISVEAELGQLIGNQFDEGEEGGKVGEGIYTDPQQAKEFVERTGCDSLAVAIGSSHGAYKFKGEPRIDLERLQKIRESISIPIVLHAASSVLEEYVEMCNTYGGKIEGSKGFPEDKVRAAVEIGVQKVNIDTDLRLAMTGGIRKVLFETPAEFDPRKYLGGGRAMIKEAVARKIKLLGSENKASLYI